MKFDPKWLLLPPAIAVLVFLGPLSMSSTANANGEPAAPIVGTAVQKPTSAAPAGKGDKVEKSDKAAGPTLPKAPDLWQVTSTVLGLLLLGGAALFVIRRFRRGAPTSGSGMVSVRQTVRLSARQALHAVEFDDQVLLLGASEHGFVLLHSSRSTSRREDEALVAARALEAEDEGAVPKNLVLPRPEHPPTFQAPTRPGKPAKTPGLSDFRTLLRKAGRA